MSLLTTSGSGSGSQELPSALRTASTHRSGDLGRGNKSVTNATNSIASRQADVFLSELLAYSLDRLRKEPELLKEEKQQVERNIQTAAVNQYGAFIKTAQCLETIGQELSTVCDHLDHLLQDIPELASACEQFSAQSGEVLEQHTQNKQLAGGQSALLELLEVPQLMDTCVRNGIYDEALDLQSFITRLGLLHPDVPVVKMLLHQVAEVGQTMLQQLLARLKSNIQLPECLRVMGYLRRIAAFSEAELRLQFLQCRDEWIAQLIDELDDSDSYEYVKHLTDIHRLHLFDAVMQYRAIFFDTPAMPQDSGAALGTSSLGTLPGSSNANVKETFMLFSWVQHRLALYVAALKQHLPHVVEGGNLASVLEHCTYCGSSLSRVGLDFQGLLQPIFEECILNLFGAHLAGSVDAFNTKLESHKWMPMPASMLSKTRADKERAEGAELDNKAGELEDLSPPYMVMEHFPLAVFINAVLNAFNELRHCALLSLARPAAGLLQQSLEHVAASLLHYRHTHVLGETELPLFKAAARTMLDVVLPYVSSCFNRIFPGNPGRLDLSSTATILRSILQDS